jgi:hypothetical protein
MQRRIAAVVAAALLVGSGPTGALAAGGESRSTAEERLDAPSRIERRHPGYQKEAPPLQLRGGAVPQMRTMQAPLAPTQRGLYVVAFKDPIAESTWAALRAAGAEKGPLAGPSAAIVRMTGKTAQSLAGHPLVANLLRYQAEHKVDADLLNGQGKADLRVVTFPGPGAVTLAGLKKLGAQSTQSPERFLIEDAERAVALQLAQLEDVLVVEEVRKPELFNDAARSILRIDGTGSPAAHGLTGRDQVIGVADTGLDNGNAASLHPDLRSRLLSATAFGRADDWSDPDGHGTHVAGSVVGDGTASGGRYKGTAPEAKLVMQSLLTADGDLYFPDYDAGGLLNAAYDAGARIHSDSWGSGLSPLWTYDSWAQQVDSVVWQKRDYTVLFAAGNNFGYQAIATPGVAKNAITIGASESKRPEINDAWADNVNAVAEFSSKGYTNDGRVKPDLVAPGTFILSTRSSALDQETAENAYWGLHDNAAYAYNGGTSMATPLAAGAAALVRQYYQEEKDLADPSAALIKATLINGAQDMGYGWGSKEQGWGRIDLTNSLYPQGDRVNWFQDEGRPLRTDGYHLYEFRLTRGEIFKASLVWTDAPGDPHRWYQLSNDLDLLVTAPNGKTYVGNCFLDKTSTGTIADGCQADGKNNVENVFIKAPVTGTYRVEVYAYAVPEGPQPYALVLSGKALAYTRDLTPPEVAISGVPPTKVIKAGTAVMADVNDNLAVQRVEFWLGKSLQATLTEADTYDDTTGEATYEWDPAGATLTGPQTLTVKAYDFDGNMGEAARPVIVDPVPVITAVTPAEGSFVHGPVTVQVTARDDAGIDQVEFYLDGEAPVFTASEAPYQWTWDTAAMASGPYNVTIKVRNVAGATVSKALTYVVDNEEPAVAVLSPADGAWAGVETPVTVAPETYSDWSKIDLFLDAGSAPVHTLHRNAATDALSEVTWLWDTRPLAGGSSHTIRARLTDMFGRTAWSPPVAVTVDNAMPVVNWESPAEYSLLEGTVTLRSSASDTISGLDAVSYYAGDALIASVTEGPDWSYTWDTVANPPPATPDGRYRLKVIAVDKAGNQSAATRTVTIRNAEPTFAITTPADGAHVRGNVPVAVTGADSADIAKVQFRIDGALKATDSRKPFTYSLNTSSLKAGLHELSVVAYDRQGQTTTVTHAIIVDNQAPTGVTLTGMEANDVLTGARKLTAQATDNLGVDHVAFYLNGQLLGLDQTAPYEWEWDTRSVANANNYRVTVRAADRAGNTTASREIKVHVDNDGPAFTKVTPADGSDVRGTVSVTAALSETRSVTQVEFFLDRDDKPVFTDTRSPYAWSWNTNTPAVAAGPHTITMRAYDSTGHISTQVVHVRVDNEAPRVAITAPADGASLPSAPHMVTVAVTDNLGVNRVEYLVNGAVKGQGKAEDGFAWQWDTARLSSRSYTLTARAYDAAGHMASHSVTVKLDSNKPSLAWDLPASGTVVAGVMPVNVTASDSGGLDKVEVLRDGQVVATLTNSPYRWAWNTLQEEPGSHTLQARAYDLAGNLTERSATFTVDNDAVSVQLPDLSDGALLHRGAEVEAVSAADITKMEFFLDGKLVGTDRTAPFTYKLSANDGAYQLYARATAKSGALAYTAPVTVVVDSKAPTGVTLTGIAAGSVVSGTQRLTVKAADNNDAFDRVEFWLDGKESAEPFSAAAQGLQTLALPRDWAFAFDTTQVADGSHTLLTKVYDTHGNVGSSKSVSFKVDNGAPEFLGFTPGGPVRGTVTLTANVRDAVGIARVEFDLDGKAPVSDTRAPYTASVNTLTLTNPDVTVRVYDLAGNRTEQTVTLQVDNEAPEALIVAPTAESVLPGTGVTWTVAVGDNDEVASMEFWVDGRKTKTVTDGPFSGTWSTAGLSSGTHKLQIRVYDRAGNLGASATVPVTVDASKPKLTVSGPRTGATVQEPVPWSATASYSSGIDRVEFLVDGQEVAADTAAPYEWTLTPAEVGDGTHKVTVKAYDALGNVTSEDRTITVDTTAPTVSFANVNDGGVVKRSFVVKLEADDAVGVVKAQFYLDSKLRSTDTRAPFQWTMPALADGTYTLRVVVTDAAGHTGAAEIRVTVDRTL